VAEVVIRMLSALARVVVGFLAAAVIIFVIYVFGLRTKSPLVVNGVRKLSRATKGGPMKSAGRPGAYASVVRHVGRTSGKQYETPVHAVRTDGGFIVALPYGASTDWVRNVLAQRSATISYAGIAYRVDRPEVLDLAAFEADFAPRERRTHRLFGVRQCLRVRQITADEPAGEADVAGQRSSDG
jgi:deazaflavin-dependent oxidoreductase (nitroreductase family)